MTIFSWWPVAPPRWPKSSNDLWYLHHNVSDPDIVVSGGPSYYALSIDASVVADKNETRRLSLFFPFLSEIQFFPLFSHNSLLRQGNPAPNGPSQWYKQPDLIIFPIVNFNHLIWQHLMGVGHGERNCKIGMLRPFRSIHCFTRQVSLTPSGISTCNFSTTFSYLTLFKKICFGTPEDGVFFDSLFM